MNKRGYIQGVFDILHTGHLQCIAKCLDNCDELIVGIMSSEWAEKHKRETILSTEERVIQMQSIAGVSEVVIYEDPQSPEVIDIVKPDIFFYGEDWLLQMDRSKIIEFTELNGVKTMMIPRYKGMSTTTIINRILSRNDPTLD